MRPLITAIVLCSLAGAAEDPRLKTFNDRVQEYDKIRKEAASKAPNLPKDAKPEEIQQHEKAVVEAIRAARPNAKQSDVFVPEVEPLFRDILKSHLAGSANKDARAAAKEGNPKHELEKGEAQPVVKVNAVYPKSAPLSTVPPLLLQQLPKLPMNLEYRFVGKTLILWDSHSNLIVDYLKEAAPGL